MDAHESERRAPEGEFMYRERGRVPRNGRSGGRARDRPRGGGRGRSEYYGGGGGVDGGGGRPGVRPPTILVRDKPGQARMPGSIAIMQRAASGGQMPSSPLKSTTSSSHNTSDPSSPSPIYTHPSHAPHLRRSGYERNDSKSRPQRNRSEGLSSSPSSFVPLQPTVGRGPRERGGDPLPTPTSSSSSRDPWSQASEMLHCVKLVDKNMHWEDKGMEYLLEQSDFLVVGVLGKQGVGKSTIMSILAGSRTGSGKPSVFRTETKEVWESESYQTTGVDMAITPERVILLDTQPMLSVAMLTQFTDNPSLVPLPMTADVYLDILSLQVAIFLYTVCHVVVVVVDSMDATDSLFKFLWTVEQMKPDCVPRNSLDVDGDGGDRHFQYFPQLVVVLNHATADDFQPFCLREHHSLLAEVFHGSKTNLAGGVSLSRSGLIQNGFGFPVRSSHKMMEDIDPAAVNFHLLPTNNNASDAGIFCVTKPEKNETGLNPLFSLLPMYSGHPSYQLLSETLRNQLFAMPRPQFCHTAQQQQFTEKEWYDYARRTWVALKKSDLMRKYEQIVQATPPE